MPRMQFEIDIDLSKRMKIFLIKAHGSDYANISKFISSAIEEKLDREDGKQ